MAPSYIAVIDIGKTNKKVLIYDLELNVVDTAFKIFNEFQDDGINYEDLDNMTLWIKQQVRLFAGQYHIKALSVTTHGATAFAIDKHGHLAIPPVAYTTNAGDEFREEFFQTFGSPQELKKETGTTEIGSLVNISKLIYFMQKKWPEKWKNVWKILNMPQYFGYLFTGKIGAEPTYIGCHTYLYNPRKQSYSSVAQKLNLSTQLPDIISKSWEILGTVSSEFQQETSLPHDCVVTLGIHDSNASLLPYLVKGFDNFVLNSTGTWCVAMHPTDTFDFRKDELDALVFYNLNAFHNPVKTSIFRGGAEYDIYRQILKEINGDQEFPAYNHERYTRIIQEKNLFILPSIDPGSGIFPNAQPQAVENGLASSLKDIQTRDQVPDFFKDFNVGMVVLNLSLAIQTYYALNMTGFDGKGTIFIEGGFRKNNDYINLLGSLYPDAKIALTKMDEATAFGAAILARAALDGVTPEKISELFDIEIKTMATQKIPFLTDYIAEFDRLIKNNTIK